jgi:hypothetical protein
MASANARAEDFHFNTPPFAGTPVLNIPGRQIVGGEQFLPGFDFNRDTLVFKGDAFQMGNQVSFANGQATALPTGGANVIVLQTTDNDNNPATPFGAANAADLIAARVTQPGPGVFIFMNNDLNLSELAYSSDLNDNASDIRILARFLSPTGPAAINSLPNFTAADFRIASVPEPSSAAMLGAGLVVGTVILSWRAKRR